LNAIPILQKHLSDESKPVKETCMLALRSLEEKAKNKCIQKSEFNTIDPIAQTVNKQNVSLDILEECLLNETCDLYERYEALFALRDMKTMQANNIIIRSLLDKTSAVFRHEVTKLNFFQTLKTESFQVAFVLGQIQTPKCTEALINCLMNTSEDSMVRHEAALALGSVACSTEVTTTESFLNNIIKNL
jgi:deoxyhypusine monooxygenase